MPSKTKTPMNTKAYRNRIKVLVEVLRTIIRDPETIITLKTSLYCVWWAIDAGEQVPFDHVCYIQYIANTLQDVFSHDPYHPVPKGLTAYSSYLVDKYL